MLDFYAVALYKKIQFCQRHYIVKVQNFRMPTGAFTTLQSGMSLLVVDDVAPRPGLDDVMCCSGLPIYTMYAKHEICRKAEVAV